MRLTLILLSMTLAVPTAAQHAPPLAAVKKLKQLPAKLHHRARTQNVRALTQKVQNLTKRKNWRKRFKVWNRWARKRVNHLRRKMESPRRFERRKGHRVVTSARRSSRFRRWLSPMAEAIRNRFMKTRLARLRRVEGGRLRLPKGLTGLWKDGLFARSHQRLQPAPRVIPLFQPL